MIAHDRLTSLTASLAYKPDTTLEVGLRSALDETSVLVIRRYTHLPDDPLTPLTVEERYAIPRQHLANPSQYIGWVAERLRAFERNQVPSWLRARKSGMLLVNIPAPMPHPRPTPSGGEPMIHRSDTP